MGYGVSLVESSRAQGQGMEIIHKEPKHLSSLPFILAHPAFFLAGHPPHSFTRIAPNDLPYSQFFILFYFQRGRQLTLSFCAS